MGTYYRFIFKILIDTNHIPLDYINSNMSEVDRDKTYYLHCRSGNRSTIAASILKARGFNNLVNVLAKYEDFEKSSIPRTAYVCPSTLK